MKFMRVIFTAFYSGYFPVAPGTVGTMVGMGIYVLEYILFGHISWIINLLIVAVMLYPAVKIGDAGEKFFGEKDPAQVVFDEVMGYWISVLFYPFSWYIVILAFFIFRFFDILKPYPAKDLQKLKGGLGIMIDDYIAGVYTNIIIFIIVNILKLSNIPIY